MNLTRLYMKLRNLQLKKIVTSFKRFLMEERDLILIIHRINIYINYMHASCMNILPN